MSKMTSESETIKKLAEEIERYGIASKKQFEFILEELCDKDDIYKTAYSARLRGIKFKLPPVKMAGAIAHAIDELCTKKNSGKAKKKDIINILLECGAGEEDSEDMLDYFESWPRKYIEYEGEYVALKSKWRIEFNISHEHKTINERVEETLKEAQTKKAPEIINNKNQDELSPDQILEKLESVEKEGKIRHKGRVRRYLKKTKCYLSKDIENSLKAAGKIIRPYEKSIKKLVQPTKDFLNGNFILRRYHIVILPFFLIGMYAFGSKVIKPIMKLEEKVIYGIDDMSVKSYYEIKNLAIKKSHEANREIKNTYNSSRKEIKNDWKYVVSTSTTTWAGLKNKIRKASVKNAAEDGASLFQGFIDETAHDQMIEYEKKK
jgi:hypothetical protein